MADKEDLRGGLFTDFADSVRGVINAKRQRGMTPEQRRAFEDKVIAKRKKKAGRLSPEAAATRALRSRDASQGLGLRRGIDPKAALKERIDKIDGG